MNPVTHGLLSWLIAEAASNDSDLLFYRERAAITVAGLAPDLDGLGIVAELATRHSEHPLLWWSQYHHVVGHNLLAAVVVSAAACAWSGRRLRCFVLAFTAFHLHIVCDLIGARGPDGHQWPIRYWWPFGQRGAIWSGQWELNAWPNVVITLAALMATIVLARRRGRSPLGIVSMRADGVLVTALRKRFPLRSDQ